MGWIRRETEKGTTQYICPNCHDYHEFREDFGEQTFNENFVFCRRCGARNGTGTAPTLTSPNEALTCEGCYWKTHGSFGQCFDCVREKQDNYRRPPEGEVDGE